MPHRQDRLTNEELRNLDNELRNMERIPAEERQVLADRYGVDSAFIMDRLTFVRTGGTFDDLRGKGPRVAYELRDRSQSGGLRDSLRELNIGGNAIGWIYLILMFALAAVAIKSIFS